MMADIDALLADIGAFGFADLQTDQRRQRTAELLDLSESALIALRARLAAAESERDVQTALLADASAQLLKAESRLREIDGAETAEYRYLACVVNGTHRVELIPRPARWSKQEGVL